MSSVIKHNEERLMKILLAPVISEKATFVGLVVSWAVVIILAVHLYA